MPACLRFAVIMFRLGHAAVRQYAGEPKFWPARFSRLRAISRGRAFGSRWRIRCWCCRLFSLPTAFCLRVGSSIASDRLETIYLQIVLVGGDVQVGQHSGGPVSARRRIGPTRVFMAAIFGVAINALVAYAIVLGHFGFPRRGVVGAAWAQNIGVVDRDVSGDRFCFRQASREICRARLDGDAATRCSRSLRIGCGIGVADFRGCSGVVDVLGIGHGELRREGDGGQSVHVPLHVRELHAGVWALRRRSRRWSGGTSARQP